MKIEQLDTPALLIERRKVERNCEAMREKAKSARVVLRPHVKTHKTIEGARLQLGSRSGPITVSTFCEGEYFAAAGFDDITLAVPIPPSRIERAIALARRVRRLGLLVDDPAMLSALEAAGTAHRMRFHIWVEIDSGAHRTGLRADAPETLLLIREIAHSEHVRFEGLLTHAGHSYTAEEHEDRARVAAEEVQTLARLRSKLQDLGVQVPAISVGSTPTATAVDSLSGADEVRPGNYIFFDAWQAALGSCSVEDCAATVLTSVIGVYPSESRIVVDAGSLALTHEPPLRPEDGWGIVCDLEGHPLPFHIRKLSQEHGELLYQPLAPPAAPASGYQDKRSIGNLKIGSRLRIIPNHACITAAMFDRFHVVDRGEVVEEWRPARGW